MNRENCPCCGYPTLKKRVFDEICLLCDWQDTICSEHTPEEIEGGPNGDYSLDEARRNFEIRLIMYRKNPKRTTTAFLEKKKRLIEAYKQLQEFNRIEEAAQWERIFELEKKLCSHGWH